MLCMTAVVSGYYYAWLRGECTILFMAAVVSGESTASGCNMVCHATYSSCDAWGGCIVHRVHQLWLHCVSSSPAMTLLRGDAHWGLLAACAYVCVAAELVI